MSMLHMSHLTQTLRGRWLPFYTSCITEAGTIVSWKLTRLRNSFHKMLHHSLLTQFSHPQFCKEYISEIDRIVHWAICHEQNFAKCLIRACLWISLRVHISEIWNLDFSIFHLLCSSPLAPALFSQNVSPKLYCKLYNLAFFV